MPDQKPQSSARNIAILLTILFVLAFYVAFTAYNRSVWILPPEAKLVKNPLTLDTAAAAKQILPVYLDKCAECHGETGKGDGPQAKMYDPRPRMLTDAPHLSTITDGELYYVITAGHKPMPSYKKKLTDEQRWQLVMLVRYFSHTLPPSTK
ncbi:MAG: cytochrome c [Acidobacteria bacterium]|nr:cytochrome c [Acidobacteriota bacterium]MBS1867359.1 cytochrome c [Acidobacteriota bacterium]